MQPENFDQSCGLNVLKRALYSPMRQVVNNSGKNGQEIIDIFVEKYNSDYRMGYDLRTE